MNEVRLCRNTWVYCDGNCHKCDVVATDVTYIIKSIFETTPITEELLKMPPADGSTIPKELWKMDDNQLSVNENRSLCKLRHKNGNCLCVGGFCTAVNDEICKSIRMAYEKGYVDGKSEVKE